MLVGAAAAEQRPAFEPDAQRDIIILEEFAIMAVVGDPGLVADHGGDGPDGVVLAVAKHLFQRLEFELAVEQERGVAELAAMALDRAGDVAGKAHADRLDDPCPGDEIADPEPVAVEQGEEQEDAAPAKREDRQEGVGGALCGLRGEEGEGEEHLDLAHRVAGDDRAAGQPRPVARHDAQPHQPLARGGPAPAHLEQHEPAVAKDEKADQPDDRGGLYPALPGEPDEEDGDDDQRHDDQHAVNHEGGGAGAGRAELKLEVDAFGGDEAAAHARRAAGAGGGCVGPAGGGVQRHVEPRRGR